MGSPEVWDSRGTVQLGPEKNPSYLITRQWTTAVYDRLRYYPRSGGPAVVRYETLSMTGSDALRGEWFAVSEAADAVLRRLIENPPPPELSVSMWQRIGEATSPIILLAILAAAAICIATTRRELRSRSE